MYANYVNVYIVNSGGLIDMPRSKPVDMERYIHVKDFAIQKHLHYHTVMMRIKRGIYKDAVRDNGLVYISRDYLYLDEAILQDRRKHTADAPDGMISGPDIAKILGLSVSRVSRIISSGVLGEVVRIWKTPFVNTKLAMAYVKQYLEKQTEKEKKEGN